jgi:peptide/nickel transport system substrate-binding protein
MKIRVSYSTLIFAAFMIVLVGHTGCKNISPNDKSNTVVTTWKSDAKTLHPVCDPPNSARLLVFEYTQKTLTRTDMRTLQQIPLLVKGLAEVSPDGKEFTYELRNDVKWDDGTPLTVDDVIFTMKVTKCPETKDDNVRSTYDKVKDIVKDPSNPLKFKMTAKEIHFMNKQIFNELYLIEKKHWDPAGVFDKISIPNMDVPHFEDTDFDGLTSWLANFNDATNGNDVKKLTGLGAYAVTDWKPNFMMVLTRKTNWWGEKDTSVYSRAYPSQIIIKIIPDDQARVLAMRNHNVDADVWLSSASFLKLQAEKDFNDHYYSGLRDQYQQNLIAINTRQDGNDYPRIFSDKNVRRAMAYLVPVDELNNTMVKGMGTRQASFIQPLFKRYYNDTLKLIPYDLKKAEKLLDEAGWKDTDGDNIRDNVVDGKRVPLRFRFTYIGSDPTNRQYALIIKEAMYKAGVDLVPDPVDLGLLQDKANTHKFDMFLSGQSGNAIPDDPDQILSSKNWGNNGSNITGFGNAESDAVIRLSNQQIDEDKRAAVLKKLQAIVYDEQPYIFLYGIKRKVVISKKYENPGMFVERPGVMLNNMKLK